MRFEWDEDKAANNFRKHGVEFEMAVEAFDDPFSQITSDRVEWGEERFRLTGLARGQILVVVHVIRQYDEESGEDYVRIISARRADRQERRDFERGT